MYEFVGVRLLQRLERARGTPWPADGTDVVPRHDAVVEGVERLRILPGTRTLSVLKASLQ